MSTSSKNIVIIVASPTPTPTRRRLVINITRYLQGDTTCKNKKITMLVQGSLDVCLKLV